jgi:hypothetical protein
VLGVFPAQWLLPVLLYVVAPVDGR